MSCFPRRHVGPTFDRERYEEIEEEAKLDFEHDQASLQSQSGFGSMVLGLFKTAHITAAMKRVVSGGKTLLNRITSRRMDDETFSDSVEKESNSYIPATETVTFPSHIVSATSPPETSVSQSPAYTSPLAPLPLTDSSLRFNNVPSVSRTRLPPVNEDEGSEVYRYKERPSSKMSLPEIEKGNVSIRARWLEPHLTGKKANENNSCMSVSGLELPFSRENSHENSPALGVLGQIERNILVEKLLLVSESDKKHEFDDSPRLYKHRTSEEEPEPWVEPGTVARGATWLEQILTGRERLEGIPKGENHPTSPARVVEARFFN